MSGHQHQDGSTVLITGCSSGIGQACALDLAARGWHVLAGVRRAEDGQRLQERGGERLRPVMLDVTDHAALPDLIRQLPEILGARGLDGLVNNAGIVTPGPLELLPVDAFRHQLEVNVLGPHALTQALLPLLRQAAGRIVLVGSISGSITPPHMGAYAASKHALEALADALRIELHSWRIRVAMVQPDSVDTPIWNKYGGSFSELYGQIDPERQALYAHQMERIRERMQRGGRHGMPVARVVAAVRHALTARRPKTHYPVGLRTRLAIWGERHLPTAWMDFFLRRAVGA